MTTFVALGERAVRFPLPSPLDRRALLAALRAIPGVIDVIVAEDQAAVVLAAPATTIASACASALASASASASASPSPSPLHTIPVVYDGEDLPSIARDLALSIDAVVALHAGREYVVSMLGFMPGFAYLRGLDPRLVIARRDSPRKRVPMRSVAIAAGYTGIYPFASPGGWHLLGQATGFTAFDARGAALALGDRVRFEPITRAPATEVMARAAVPPPTRGPWLEVRAAHGPALLIDGGRPGHMHEGVPHGGPMVRCALAKANVAAGNPARACAIEVYGALELVACGGRVTIADDVDGARVLDEGEAFRVAPDPRRRLRYIAVRGGFDVPIVLGGRGTMLVAAMGGFEGRPLRRGDRIAIAADADASTNAEADASTNADAIAIVAGPDADEGEVDDLLRRRFVVAAASDRTGTRLEGPALPARHVHSARTSAPMVLGAIERTPAGLIVLGPDHPTTGGYPVIAVLCERSWDRFFGLPVGHPVRFDLAT